jgi:hypothetical protein
VVTTAAAVAAAAVAVAAAIMTPQPECHEETQMNYGVHQTLYNK